MFPRKILNDVKNDFFKGKVLLIIGARQVGKTTLINKILSSLSSNYQIKSLNLDNNMDRELLEKSDFKSLDNIFVNDDFIFIDEAQRLSSIGIVLKILVDNYKNTKQIIATGSSSINLLDNTGEPLTGRKFTYNLYPLSLQEIYSDSYKLKANINTNLIYGCYPEVLTQNSNTDKTRLLRELTTSNLYKDILEFQEIRNPEVLSKMLKLLALQIGSEVSYSELGMQLGIDSKTVERYVDLMEKSFVIFRLSAYSTNKRREISKNKKIFFYDVGIRNTIIDNFKEPNSRSDMGALWENFLITERLKFRNYNKIVANQYFWRTYDQNEIDLVEEFSEKLNGFEFKFSKSHAKRPISWAKYKNSEFKVINKDNLENFVY